MHRLYFQRLGLCNEQGEAPVTASGGTDEPKLTIGAQIKAAIAAKADLQTKIATLETQAATDKATITDLTSKLEAANAKIAVLETDAAEVKAALDAHMVEVGQLKAKDKDLDKRAEQQAKEKLGALGFPSAKLPVADAKGAGSYEEALQAYSDITDPVKAAAFYASNIQPYLDGTKK